MNVFEEHRAYLADNPKGYWFKRKIYGYGWTPATWQGWALTAAYLLFIFGLLFASTSSYAVLNPEKLVWPIIAATLLYVAITWRMGEPLKWQWGLRKDADTAE